MWGPGPLQAGGGLEETNPGPLGEAHGNLTDQGSLRPVGFEQCFLIIFIPWEPFLSLE